MKAMNISLINAASMDAKRITSILMMILASANSVQLVAQAAIVTQFVLIAIQVSSLTQPLLFVIRISLISCHKDHKITIKLQ